MVNLVRIAIKTTFKQWWWNWSWLLWKESL